MKHQEEAYFLDKFLAGSTKYRKNAHYEPLEITFYLSSPLSLTHPWIHFDGLISHLFLLDILGEDFYLLPRKFVMTEITEKLKALNFPLKNTSGLFHASISFFDDGRKGLEVMYKKFEDRWAGGKKKIYRGSGYFRDYCIQHIYVAATKVTFYVHGDKEILETLCGKLLGLGDNSRIGWGAIRKCEVKSISEDCSIVKDGKAMRPIPNHMFVSASEKIALAWKPPYWDPTSVAICAPPGASVELTHG